MKKFIIWLFKDFVYSLYYRAENLFTLQVVAVAPDLAVAGQFGVLAGAGVTGSAGVGTVVNGDVGSNPNPAVSNFPPSSVTPPFVLHLAIDAVTTQAQTDLTNAYNFLLAQGAGTVLPAQLNGQVLTAGLYSFDAPAVDLSAGGTLTLNGAGIFVFQVDSSLTMNVLSQVIGTANPCNVYWRIGASGTLNGITTWGTFIALTSLTVGAGSNVVGRVLARNGAVTMAGAGGNEIGGCSSSCPVITLSPATLPDGRRGRFYAQTIVASGGVAPYSYYVVSGSLPTGVTLNSSTGEISGTASVVGDFTFTIGASDANGCEATTQQYTVTIAQGTLSRGGGAVGGSGISATDIQCVDPRDYRERPATITVGGITYRYYYTNERKWWCYLIDNGKYIFR